MRRSQRARPGTAPSDDARREEDRSADAGASATSAPVAFDEFFREERDRLFRILCAIVGSRAEAEEIAQEAFVVTWERWETVSVMDNPAGYLYRVAVNRFRRRYRRAVSLGRAMAGLVPPGDVYEGLDDRLVLMSALAGLSPRQRAAVVLTELLGYPAEETGRMLGIRASTVRALAFQGRRAMRDAIGGDR